MEFNKCSRCGNFFISDDDVCPKCKAKDTLEFETFKNYVSENGLVDNLDSFNLDTVSNDTGISMKNLNRYIKKDIQL